MDISIGKYIQINKNKYIFLYNERRSDKEEVLKVLLRKNRGGVGESIFILNCLFFLCVRYSLFVYILQGREYRRVFVWRVFFGIEVCLIFVWILKVRLIIFQWKISRSWCLQSIFFGFFGGQSFGVLLFFRNVSGIEFSCLDFILIILF